MATTTQDYITLHGSSVLAAVQAASPEELDLVELYIERAWNTYDLATTSEDTATEDMKEMVALTALYNMIQTGSTQNEAVAGAIQKVKVGSDGTPEVTYFNRIQQWKEYVGGVVGMLTGLQRKLGYVPFLSPTPSDVPFVFARLDMIEDEVTT